MATKKKSLQAAAGNAGGDLLAIEDVFSTYLYTGNGSTQTITNGIDLAGEGGLVWLKDRNSGFSLPHSLTDTLRGNTKILNSATTGAEVTLTNLCITGFNSDGFGLGTNTNWNNNGTAFASWTFRKAPRFFDVVTYTGTGSVRTIAHNLGVAPGCIIIKETSATRNWYVYHRSNGSTKYMRLNLTDAAATSSLAFDNTDPTDTEFTVGTVNGINNSGASYVAYLFAHDPLGPSGDGSDGLIACGSFTTDASGLASVNLGWEPQWVMVKKTNATGTWLMLDNMRGMPNGSNKQWLGANSANAEASSATLWHPTATGFDVVGGVGASDSLIYIAIRRGPMRQPESGTEVFAVDNGDGVSVPAYNSGFPVDMAFKRLYDGIDNTSVGTRLLGNERLQTNTTAAGSVQTGNPWFAYMDGWYSASEGSRWYSWMFRRAPGFFDVVAYTGNGTTQAVPHSLRVSPEFIFVKRRNSTNQWSVFNASRGSSEYLVLNATQISNPSTTHWNATDPTSADFTVGGNANTNGSGGTYIAYLFATLDGVSKVGSYTGNGTSQTIDCGFTTGARFVLIKRTDSTGDWYVWDTARGIVAANDPHLSLNTTAAQVTTDDSVDPDSSGFIVNQVAATNINVSSATYIFYAIA